jgi:hypothetical protein
MATIVVTRQGQSFLGQNEMSFLDYFAARGGLMTPQYFTSGLRSGVTWPFYLATGGRGCMVTTIDYDGGCFAISMPAIRK